MWRWLMIVTLCLLVAACGSEKPATKPDPTGETGQTGSDMAELRRDYEALRTAHTAIAAVWENLAQGQTARCEEYPDVLNPESISGDPAADELVQLLRRAAIGTQEAVDLWKAECTNSTETVPPQVIGEALLTVRGAGDALNEAEVLLNRSP